MPSKMLMIGAGIFGASVFLVLILLVANGGANKSRQFEVLGDLLAGRQGALMRVLLFAALGGLVVGMLTTFSAVSSRDADRRKQCQDTCAGRGFTQGVMGLSATTRHASGRPMKICRCTGGPEKDQEIDMDTLPQSDSQ